MRQVEQKGAPALNENSAAALIWKTFCHIPISRCISDEGRSIGKAWEENDEAHA